ncbi:MAG: chromosomal replication initiator protein DnaA [Anaerovoracaceae bacterium]
MMSELQKTWDEILKQIEPEVTPVSYRTWFTPLLPTNIDENLKIFYIKTSETFVKNIIMDRYLILLENTVENVLKQPYKVVVKLQSDDEEKEEKKIKKEINKSLKEEFYFNPRYNFENFVVSKNNNHAHAVAVAVAEAPSVTYNPVFIYGGSGLGKTHLMHAIGHYILDNHPNLKVLYVSSEMFTNELIKSLADKGSIRAFKNKYRKIDVLLIDDIQFIEGKQATQEEFFHTFNTLYDLNKQIIISSDRPPNKLTNLEERLRSRFQWNIIADIQPPDYETRVAILRKKAELEDIEIDDNLADVMTLIAEKIKFNVRELEGAFSRVTSFSKLLEKPISVKFARDILKDILSSSDVNISCEGIKKTVCKNFNIKVSDIESSKRTRNLAFPRQIAMYLCREMTDTSLPKIGYTFGKRDHSTVLHACNKIASEINTNTNTADIVKKLKEEINL